MTAAQPIGVRIKRARERRRWSQRQLADALGVNVKSIDNWESGRTKPRSSIGALEQVLGIDLSGEDGRVPSGLADLLPLTEDDAFEQQVFEDPDLPDQIKRRFIEDRRRLRAEYDDLRRSRRAAEDARPGRHRAS